MPTPSLTIFIFALSPKSALLVCLFLQRKEGKGGRYTQPLFTPPLQSGLSFINWQCLKQR